MAELRVDTRSVRVRLPNRPLTLTSPFRAASLASILGGVGLALAVCVALASAFFADLTRDTMIGQDYAPASAALSADCRQQALFVYCRLETRPLGADADATPARTERILYVGRVPDPVPGHVGRDAYGRWAAALAQDRLWNRWLVLLVLLTIFAGGGAFYAQQAYRERRIARAASAIRSARVTPTTVVVDQPLGLWRSATMFYRPRGGGRAFTARTPRDFEPLVIAKDGDKNVALALVGPVAGTPILVDARLETLDLTREERAAAFTALGLTPPSSVRS